MMLALAIGIGLACIAIFIVFIAACFTEIESRLGRKMSGLEMVAFIVCFPYSLLAMLIIPQAKKDSSNG